MAMTGRIKELVHPLNRELLEYGSPWYGEFARDISDLQNGAWVKIIDFDQDLIWGPLPWQARDATSLPSVGDPCIVLFDNRRNPWVVAWWPFQGEVQEPPPQSPQTDVSGRLKKVGNLAVEQKTVTAGSGTGGGGGGNNPVTTSTRRGVLHDTEGNGDYDGQVEYMRNHYPPHFAIGSDKGRARITQFYPLGVSSDATAAHDFEIWCQIEIIAPNGAANYSKGEWRSWMTPFKDQLQNLMSSVGVPMTYQGAPTRGQNWAQSGWFGHMDVPDNDHGDPGANFPWSDFL